MAEKVAALKGAEVDGALFDERERAVIRFVDEVTRTRSCSDECFAALRRHLREDQVVELSFTVGFWNLWNRFTHTFKFELEEGFKREVTELEEEDRKRR